MKNELIICSVLFPGSEMDTLLLVESIRHFGGKFSDHPIWLMTADYSRTLDAAVVKRLQTLDTRIIPFNIEKEKLNFFFTRELTALAQAEPLAAAETDCMVWMDANTIMVNEPTEFFLPDGVVMGYRPVQHLLVGSQYDKPLDPFWTEIYKACEVPEASVFPMRLTVQNLDVRPYFNAGFLLLRPQSGLVQRWYQKFTEIYQTPTFLLFYENDGRYEVFMHQAVLAGVVLNSLKRDQLRELPRGYNYPVDLFGVDDTGFRPRMMDDVITFRHEEFYEENWRQLPPASDGLTQWIKSIRKP
jgi:hypothetical protein